MTKLIKFRIKNYKSVLDSGYCYLNDDITILAGKNESGKTSLLEALEDFNIDQEIREESIPIHDEDLKPEIEIDIKLDKEDIKKIFENFNIPSQKVKELEIKIKKLYPNSYVLEDKYASELIPYEKSVKNAVIKNLKFVKDEIKNIPISEDYVNNEEIINMENFKPEFIEELTATKKIEDKCLSLGNFVEELNKIKKFKKEFEDFLKENILPNFILFKTFEDILPNQTPLNQVSENNLLNDLAFISSLDFGKIQADSDARKKEMHKREINLKFSEGYKEFWKQDESHLYFSLDSNNIYFWVKEGEELYRPEIRSKGRQWYLSFYIRATARSLEERNNIILIDEPGLFLHAKAQRDILNKLEECAERTQVIYTTHSPYLIQSDKLSRIRLIIKEGEKGTTINKITAKADKETLTPILTAIGEDLSVGIRVDIKNSFIVEGLSDYYYIHAFNKLLGYNYELNIIPGCGDNLPAIGSILFGWGLDPFFILDNDKKRLKNKLMSKLGISEESIIFILEGSGSIENLFSEGDFRKIVLKDPRVTLSVGIDKYIKSKKFNKVLLAKDFIDSVNNRDIKKENLSQDTIKKVGFLFSKIRSLIPNS